eukprot:gnl/MRDRNA2_/MRDRNA2_79581_c0_seq1.p1 gnl/MRDRNA2_/MRDRNA2_79581_c0~~gnl/MRDRNA2_/MRDRNA2_79581_c0_seq1.p1  ORF type:complete len:110 (-),score=15.40 gnl/MRDRNA2_/MRDRNA2_79581_c0_seq1:256-585(-)
MKVAAQASKTHQCTGMQSTCSTPVSSQDPRLQISLRLHYQTTLLDDSFRPGEEIKIQLARAALCEGKTLPKSTSAIAGSMRFNKGFTHRPSATGCHLALAMPQEVNPGF